MGALLALSLITILSSSFVTTALQAGVQRVAAENTNITNNNNNNNNSKINFLTFRNNTLGVSRISYPSYWKVSQANDIVSFGSPLKTVGVKLVIIPSVNMSLDEFTARLILGLTENLINLNINRSLTGEFLNNPAEMLIFTYRNSNKMSESLQVWTIKDDKAYVAMYFADAVLYDTFLPTALNIINSIKLTAFLHTTIFGGINNDEH